MKTVPTFSCFSLCDECVLRCQMCQKWKDDLSISSECKLMELDEWKKCAVSLKEFAPENFVINFGGGEVTMVPWLFELVGFCHDLGFVTNVATNGFLIDEAMVTRINDSKLDYINLSLDSLNENIHDTIRGRSGVYPKVMRAIDLIAERAPETKICITSVLMEPTFKGMPELVKWAQNNDKISIIGLMALMQPNNTKPDDQWYNHDFKPLWPKDYELTVRILDELIDFKQKGFKISNKIKNLQALKKYFYDPMTYVKKAACNTDQAVHISSVGDMFMCYEFPRMGDVREKDIKTLWESDAAVEIRKDIQKCRQNCHFLLNCNFEDD